MTLTLRSSWAAARRAIDAGRLAEARTLFDALLTHPVDDPEVHYEYAWLLRQLGDYEHALTAYQVALDKGARGQEEIHLNRAVIFTDALHDHVAAERELLAALSVQPRYLPALLNLGNLYEDLGRREDAIEAYRRALATPEEPLRAEALARLLKLHSEPVDALLAEAGTLLEDARVPIETRANLAFAVGHAREHRRDYDGAFAAFVRANQFAGSTGPAYDPAQHERWIDSLINATPSPSMEATADAPTPIFICGMFRSGSTLLEQVLNAHPQVCSGGELSFFPHLARNQPLPFPQCMAAWTVADFSGIAAAYRAHIKKLWPGQSPPRFFVDKRPDNFLLLPLIRRVFPRARILYTHRDPMDNGLSVFQQYLDQAAAPYNSTLPGIAHFYAQQQRLLACYQQQFGSDLVLFEYERFVAEPETQLRRILGELGLDWEPGCLDFHRRPSVVKTASVWQVRQPVHENSRLRWLRYRKQLAPLVAELDRLGVAYRQS